MADEKELKYKITSQADNAGVDSSNRSLDDFRKTTEKSGEATKEHEQKILGLNLGMGETRRAVTELRNQMPLLTEAWTAFTNPAVFGVTMLIAAFAKAKEALSEWNKELDEMAAKQAEATFLPGIEARVEKLRELNTETAKYHDHLQNLITVQEQLNTKYRDEKALREATAAANEKIASAQDKAAIDAINNKPNLSQDEKNAAIAAIGLGGEARGGAAQHRADQAGIQDLINQQFGAQVAGRTLPGQVSAAEAANRKQLADIAQAKANLAAEEKRQEDLKKTRDAEAERFAYITHETKLASGGIESIYKNSPAYLDAKARADAAASAYDQSRGSTLPGGKLYGAANAMDTTSAPLERIRAAQEENNKILQELPEKIATQLAIMGQHDRGNAGALGADIGGADSGALGGMIHLAGQAVSARNTFQQSTAEATQAIHDLVALARAWHAALTPIQNNLQVLANDRATAAQKQAATDRIIAELAKGRGQGQ